MAEKIEVDMIIKAITEGFDKIKTDLGDTAEAEDAVTSSTADTSLSMADLNAGIEIAQKAFEMLNQALDATVGFTVEYAKEVRDLSRTIGATPEETSKLIQAADDVNVSYQTMTTAMETAIRKGVSPTVEGMGALADEYNAIQDPIERTKFLMDRFGRSGADLAPLMELGAAGIREAGDAAEATGLVLSGQSVQAARDYEIAMDNLGDAVDGLKVKIGTALLPILLNANTALTLMVSGNQQVQTALTTHAEEVETASTSYQEYVTELERAAKAAGYNIDAEGNLTKQVRDHYGWSDKVITQNYRLTQTEYSLQRQTDDRRESIEALESSTQTMIDANEDLEASEDAVKQSMSELSVFMAGDLGKENDTFVQKNEDLRKKLAEVEGKIQDLEKLDYLTDDQRTNLDELKTKQSEIKGEITATADAHEEATKRILWNMLQQQLGADGLSAAEAKSLGAVAESWGLIDQDTLGAWTRMQDYIASLDGAEINANELAAAVQNIPDTKTITMSIIGGEEIFTINGIDYNPVNGYASGGIIPPGYPNDSFPAMLSSYERVLTPGEQVDIAGSLKQLTNAILSQRSSPTANEMATAFAAKIAQYVG